MFQLVKAVLVIVNSISALAVPMAKCICFAYSFSSTSGAWIPTSGRPCARNGQTGPKSWRYLGQNHVLSLVTTKKTDSTLNKTLVG